MKLWNQVQWSAVIENNILAFVLHVGVDLFTIALFFNIAEQFQWQSELINRTLSFLAIALYILVGTRIRSFGSWWKDIFSVISVSMLNLFVYAFCYIHYFNDSGGMRGIIWLLFGFANAYGMGLTTFLYAYTNLTYTSLILAVPIPSFLLWAGIRIRRHLPRRLR